MTAACVECGRRFDLTDETDAEEWAYGHDCED
jgi:ferredoxin-like protein FixX